VHYIYVSGFFVYTLCDIGGINQRRNLYRRWKLKSQ